MKEFPGCTCGHSAEEHNHSPSGCGTTHCQHDSNDYGIPNCQMGCREYEPDEPCQECGHLFTDHEQTDLDCLATVHIPPYPERPCECAEYVSEYDAELKEKERLENQKWLKAVRDKLSG